MKITIIPSDGMVGIDGVFRSVDMTGIDLTIHAVQFDKDTGYGEVEYKARGAAHRTINSILEFQIFLDRWATVS